GGSLDPFKLFDHVSIDLVKFDGTYTQDLGNKESRDKFGKMIERASEANKQVLVGFVESANQMQTLWTLNGVNYLQGYYLQPPTNQLVLSEEKRTSPASQLATEQLRLAPVADAHQRTNTVETDSRNYMHRTIPHTRLGSERR